MRTILLLSFLVVSTFSFSQKRIGIKGGFNADTRIQNLHRRSQPRQAFSAGVFAEIPIGRNNYEQFYFQPEILYSAQGERSEVDNSSEENIFNLDYILVPLMFKAYFSEDINEFYAIGGPQLGFLIREDLDIISNRSFGTEFKTFDISLSLGLGYSYQRKYEAYLRYSFGLNDIAEGGTDGGVNHNRNSRFSIGIAYIFD